MRTRLARGILILTLLILALAVLLSRTRVPPPPSPSPSPDPYQEARSRMVQTQIVRRGVQDERVLKAMARVPRHLFVPADYVSSAYGDHPLPIGFGQTISQPYIVAIMSELLGLEPGEKVLEIGTGSGYQAAILAEMGQDVYTVEIIPQLAQEAQERLRRLGYDRVHTLNADGYNGWPEHAPYDGIIVTAAPDHVPQPLLQQLADGGHLVIPVGPQGSYQVLWQFIREGAETKAYQIMDVLFVPLVREVR